MSALFSCTEETFHVIQDRLSVFTVNEEDYIPYERCERRYEVHRAFIDVQFVTEGEEDCAIIASGRLQEELPFDEAKDIAFYSQTPKEDVLVHLRPCLFCVIYPGEAHMPCLAPSPKAMSVHKCVAKIPLRALNDDPLLLTRLFSDAV